MTTTTFITGVLTKSFAALALSALIAGCAATKPSPMFEQTSTAIRAAETAGAPEYAPDHYLQAKTIFRKAEAMQQRNRTERAQKLLELATAQASLAKAISEAVHAENSLGYIRTGMIR